jgi:predicted  nucleic acid-binding Zn-ribbon protein
MKFSEYILESRVDDFRVKYGRKFNQETLDKITNMVSPKFLDWVGKVLDMAVLNDNFLEYIYKIGPSLDAFEKISSNLPKTDINQYQSFDELLKALNDYQNKPRREYKKIEGGNVVFENDRFLVVNPLTHETSCYYGKGTKWCTAADSDHHFNQYNSDGKLFYILDKALPTSDVNYKVALLQKFDGDSSFWNAKDDKMFEKWFIQHNPQAKEIMEAVNGYLESQFKEQLEIFRDKERAKLERERQEKLRIRRIIEQRRNEADERRAEGEWDLTNPNIDEIGLKANALFAYLESEGDYQILTNEDKEKIQSLRSEIERLNNEYNDSEDVRTDLLDSVETLEDELAEFDEYIDVYSLIPQGTHYDMTTFQLVESLNEEYAVADEDEMESSARDYVEQLIDDIGYEGFSKNFVMGFIDEDAVVSYMEDFYDDDVRNNPEIYFDESERDFSDEQKDKINFNNKTIQQLESFVSSLEDELNDTEDDEEQEELNEKIEESNEKIEELTEEIEEIESEPNGDFPEKLIEEKVDDLLDDVKRDVEHYMNEFGLNYEDYIDKDEFIKGLIDSDGYGMVGSYDGNVSEYYIKDETFYVMRLN